MLRLLRAGARTWVAKLLFILLVGSFAVWGISGTMLTGTGDAVVTVGDTEVSPTEFRLAYDRQLALLSQQFGTRITRDQARALGLENRVYSQLVSGAALDEQAKGMNLGVSDDRLASLIGEDPAFQGLDGRFSRQAFSSVLANAGMTQEDYIRSREEVAVRTQIIDAVADGFELPEAMVDAVARHQAEVRAVDYLVIDESMVEPVGEPSDEELTAYFEENAQQYRAPEYRSIAYVAVTADALTDPAAVSEEAVQQAYEENRERYSTPEQRTIDQIVFADQETAEAAAARLQEGVTFDKILADQGLSATDVRIGTFTQSEMSSPALAEAAFAVEEAGGTSGMVEGNFGPVILRVAEIEPGATQELADVEAQIREDLAHGAASDRLFEVYTAYEDARAAGLSLEDAAREVQLEPVTIEAIDSQGLDPQGEEVGEIPERPALLAEAFQTDVGAQVQPVQIGSQGYLFFQVLDVEPARDRELDEVRDQVVADWKADMLAQALADRASEISAQVAEGLDLQAAAEAVGTTVRTEYGLQRQANGPVFGRAAITAIFNGPEGHVAAAPAADGNDQLVMKVVEVAISATAALSDDERQQIASGAGNALLDQMIARLQMQYPVSINQQLGQQALAF